MTFADRLRQLREERGITQAGLADASGLPLGSIRNYEQGQREPYWAVVFKLAAALGVSCDKFRDCVPDAVAPEPPAVDAKLQGRPKKALAASAGANVEEQAGDAPQAKREAAKKGRKAKGT